MIPWSAAPERVCILLGLYNGAPDLQAQLDSFTAQSHAGWDLIVSDDGSHDEGPLIVDRFAATAAGRGHRVDRIHGPQAGFALNFLHLIRQAPEQHGYLAFSDQDDVWLPDRLAHGVAALKALPADRPALYCSRTLITDHALENRRLSGPRPRPASFHNALVQNIASGNTILLNRAAADLAYQAAAEVEQLVAHDWWLYQLVTGAGGTVVHDDRPALLYRQHDANLIGANDGWRAKLHRIAMIWQGRFADWNDINIEALRLAAPLLTLENRTLLERFAHMRALPGPRRRLAALGQMGLYRQSRASTWALWLAAALGKL